MSKAKIYHNPRFGRSRQTLAPLRERPFAVVGSEAALGRPPENVLDIL